MPTKKTKYNPSSPAVEQAAQLLLCLGRQNDAGLGLTAICKDIGIHKSKGYSILNALAKFDLITRDDATKAYSLGPALMPLGRKVTDRFDIHAAAREHLETFAAETRTSVLLGMISNDLFYVAGKYDGIDMLTLTVRQYHSLPVTHGAHGKAIYAFLDEAEQQRLLDSGQVFFHGEPDAFDRERLEKEAALCREQGYAVDNGEQTPGIRAVSAPLLDHTNRVVAAVVSVGMYPETELPALGRKLAETARMISRQAGAKEDL